ncbi:MAG: hypothetical protein LBC83_01100 [Oscillospiraceae bacterium]|jgi:penicillin-binding protein 2|nr:hypothetical protein [Oscillospiraceae bacterium]
MKTVTLKKLNRRGGWLLGLLLAVLSGFVATLAKVQLVDGPRISEIRAITSSSVAVPAARGILLDRSGIPLVENKASVSLIFEHPYFPDRSSAAGQARRNALLVSLLALFEKHGADWLDPLPIQWNAAGQAEFLPEMETEIAELKSPGKLNLNTYATAQNCLDALAERYDLKDYDAVTARKLASVQYGMWRVGYTTSTPYTFAEDVPGALVSVIKENSTLYAGVNSKVVPIRSYLDGTLAPHILGRVGAISESDYAAHKEEGYKLNDVYGASGIERAAEGWLRGHEGLNQVMVDSNGNAETVRVQEAVQGNTVVLTIDSGLQRMVQDAFPKYMTQFESKRADVPIGGAVVVLDVNSFAVLAAVSYPDYDVTAYAENVAALAKDPAAPLWDRVLRGTYEPGSTIKPSGALAALQEGIITENYTYNCTGKYHFLDTTFKCDQVRYHGGRPLNVYKALVDSCNSFFYEMGRILTYEKLNAYRLSMGLGQKTGTELPEETGVMDSPERRALLGQQWFAGYNIQTGIGQNNLFTPMQIAVYAATIANGGTRYRAHFIQSVRNSTTMEPLLVNQPEVLGTTGVAKEHYALVRSAMLRAGTYSGGSAERYLGGLPVEVAAKTGTSQVVRSVNGVPTRINNGIFITFAPYDKPEIAVIAVGEGCNNSEPTMPIVRDIYEYYFGSMGSMVKEQAEGELLG